MKLRLVATAALALTSVVACKTSRGGGESASATKDIEDTQQINYIPSADSYMVICRDGRTHHGEKTVLVTKQELRTVCEDKAGPGGPGNGGGNHGGGNHGNGGNGGAPVNVFEKCPTVPDRVKLLNLALTPGFISSLSQLPPAVAQQQICVSLTAGLQQVVQTETAFKFLTTGGGGLPILIIIDVKEAPVAYAKEDFILTLPARITPDVLAQIDAQLGSITCGGKRIETGCWTAGRKGEDCNQACAAIGMGFDPLTISFGGSGGTAEQCATLAKAFGMSFAQDLAACSTSGNESGCSEIGSSGVFRCFGKPTTATWKLEEMRRICACK